MDKLLAFWFDFSEAPFCSVCFVIYDLHVIKANGVECPYIYHPTVYLYISVNITLLG